MAVASRILKELGFIVELLLIAMLLGQSIAVGAYDYDCSTLTLSLITAFGHLMIPI
jgi:hypothetical protein